jgi:P pilus assembly protein, porin PapC
MAIKSTNSIRRSRICSITWLVGIYTLASTMPAISAEIVFNSDILDVHDRSNIDLTQFSHAGYIMPGSYTMSVYVNKNEYPEQTIVWMVPKGQDAHNSMPCLSQSLIQEIGLKTDVISRLSWWNEGQCLELSSLPGATVQGDLGASSVYLNIPQAYLEYRAENWDPISLWDEGIPGLILDYYMVAQKQRQLQGSGDSNTINGNGVVGANVGPWRLRADWQARYEKTNGDSGPQSAWDWSRVYAYRALPKLGAKLTVGENYLYSDIFDSFRFTGLSLVSDDNMLPPNLRGYAPEVSGVAKTNARVIISQQGRVLQETQVAAGPFRIQDLNNMISGTINVRIEELDGTIQTFDVDTASIPYLTRPGMIRYKIAGGRPSNWQHNVNGPAFTTGEFSWGVNNGWSLYGGGVGSEKYSALAVGVGRDLMAFGAISFDTTQSRANLPKENTTLTGRSYRLSYSKRFSETGSQMTFAGYRFSERDFMSMGDFLEAREFTQRYNNRKEMYTVTFNQQFRELRLSAYLNYSHQTYWERSDTDRYSISASKYFDLGEFRNLSLSATAYRNKYHNTNDDGMFLSLSFPWGGGGTLSYNTTITPEDNNHQLNYSNQLDNGDSYSVSAGSSRQGLMTSGYYNHQGDFVQTNGSVSYQAGRSSSVSLALQGGATVTAEGAALHRTGMQGGTRMLLDTDGVANIPIRGYGQDSRSNLFGKAVVSDVSSYYRNQINIDVNKLPDNADVGRSVVQATLTEGAIGYRKFEVIAGEKAMAVLTLVNGSFPPFGAVVQNAKHKEVGIVNDNGNVYLSGIQPDERMSVTWDGKIQCELSLPSVLPVDTTKGLLLPCK